MAVPEHLFHYPAIVLPREWGGDFLKEPWGTGPYTLDKYVVSEQALAGSGAPDYWQEGQAPTSTRSGSSIWASRRRRTRPRWPRSRVDLITSDVLDVSSIDVA